MSRSRSDARPTPTEPVEGTLRPADHADASENAGGCSIRRSRQPPTRHRRLAPLGLAPAHLDAHRARAAAAARDRRGSRLPRAAAQRRPERRHAVLHRQPRPCADPRQPQHVRRVHVAVVLGDLHPAVRVAHRVRHPAHEAPLEGARAQPAAHARAPRPPRRAPRVDRGAHPRDGCRSLGRAVAIGPRRAAAEEGRLSGRALRLGCDALGLGRTRLSARDRQPRLPHGAHRRAARRRAGRRIRLHRAGA